MARTALGTLGLVSLFACFGLACSGVADVASEAPVEVPAPSTGPTAPREDARLVEVRAIYERYLADDPPRREDLPLSKRLRASWTTHNEDVDFDPIIDAQDYALTNIEVTLDGDEVVARFTNGGETREVRWVMVQDEGRWVIDDLRTARWSLATLTSG